MDDYVGRAGILKGQDPAAAHADAKVAGTQLLKAMQLPCEVVDAEPVGRGKTKINGKVSDVRIYEVACGNGLGYIVVSQGDAEPYAISCFSADATYALETAAGRKSDMFCQLPANKDVKVMAASVMSAAGTKCAVQRLQWFGRSAQSHTEYSEVVCDGGGGYLLRTAQAGSDQPPTVMSCQDAAQNGIKCRLTDAGPVVKPVTLDTLKEALAAGGVKCSATQTRLVGQESKRKRYVVEFQCPEYPKGLVAFIPTGDNTNKLETLSCADAVSEHVLCELTAN
ncbi:MAG TPA: hypothetical protein VE046_03260 [Steroidobacteraceae bacterium]|nr:hypothetical protein [Steroidobacteraceae bacterium]